LVVGVIIDRVGDDAFWAGLVPGFSDPHPLQVATTTVATAVLAIMSSRVGRLAPNRTVRR